MSSIQKIILVERMEKYLKINNSDLHLKYGACFNMGLFQFQYGAVSIRACFQGLQVCKVA